MVWVCSDWHFNHDKEFIWGVRGFESVEEMNETIIRRHNYQVAENDDVYVLGDLCMGSDLASNKALIERLNGRIHVVFGNHDTENRKAMYAECKNVVELCGYGTMLKYKKYSFLLTHWPTNTSNYDENKPLRACLINICGHVHTTDKLELIHQGQLSFHAEMEGNQCAPVSLDHIITVMEHSLIKCECDGDCANCKCPIRQLTVDCKCMQKQSLI